MMFCEQRLPPSSGFPLLNEQSPWEMLRNEKDGSAGSHGEDSVERSPARIDDTDPKGNLLCRACGHRITSLRAKVERMGSHEHTKVNPAGIVFRLGCFGVAPGAVSCGPATDEHTWFPGFVWQFTLCARCGFHLGWTFSGDTSSFFGLVLDRLQPEG